ncbi:MAG: hypothetical protein PHQ52_03650 [Candidatus Omnitrophica bacterium]|nr:hypothetical protein [Candidatus Omnitrophota bacterium]
MFIVKRSIRNPILTPLTQHPWETFATFNWAPVSSGDKKEVIHCVYRAITEPVLIPKDSPYISSIGYAMSKDGINYYNRAQLIKPEFDWEQYGCEDPRVTKMNGKYFIFYTALSLYPFQYDGIKVACAITKDFKTIESKHLVTPFNAKAMALFPAKINGKLAAILTVNTDNAKRTAKIAIAEFDKEEDIWNPVYWKTWYRNLAKHTLRIRRTITDHVEVGAAPIKTKYGWLLIYAHIQDYNTNQKIFGIEALLLDLKDPKKIIGRTHNPIFVPQETYEKYGQIPDVIFPSGALLRDQHIWIYYGAADTTSCIAEVRLDDLVNSMDPVKRHNYVKRYKKNPTLEPIAEHPFESRAVFNPAAVDIDGKVHIVYRAMSEDNTSTMGYAVSKDGLKIDERLSEPIYVPRKNFEGKGIPNGNSGCEDPRITRIGNMLHMCYTAYNGLEVPRVALSSISVKNFLSRAWDKWSEPIIITPAGIDDKDACIMPEKVNGQYMVIHRIKSQICVDFVNSLETIADEVTKGIRLMGPRHGMWDSKKIGLAGTPIKTKEGWLFFYHGVSEENFYSLGAALLDLKNPMHILARTNESILRPEKKYELEGQIPNVVFPCGHILRGDTIYHYYGGGDTVIGVATHSLSDLLKMMS